MKNKCKNRNCENSTIGRKQYCSDRCKYWENQIKKDEEKGLPPKKKRTAQYFYKYSHTAFSKGQGKRRGDMITGAMTGTPTPFFIISETTTENLRDHFKHQFIHIAELCNGELISRKQFTQSCKNNP